MTENPASTHPDPTLESREEFIKRAMAEFESPLIGYAASILNDSDRARDVVQDTFLKLCHQQPARVAPNLKAWLFTVCRNRAFDLRRKDKPQQPLAEIHWQHLAGPGLRPDQQSDLEERIAHLNRLLNRLSDDQRDVILLKFQQGLSYQEIHEITGLNPGNIGFLIHTGLKRLRELLPEDLKFPF